MVGSCQITPKPPAVVNVLFGEDPNNHPAHVFAQGSLSHVIDIDNEQAKRGVKARRLCVEVGDSVKIGYDPSFALSAWENEVSMRLRLKTAFTSFSQVSPEVSS